VSIPRPRQSLLRLLKLLEETVLENIHFVQIQRHPLMNAAVANIADFECVALPQLPLDPEVPRLGVWLLDVRIHAQQPGLLELRSFGELRRIAGWGDEVVRRETAGQITGIVLRTGSIVAG
jgi:hypothetical protein